MRVIIPIPSSAAPPTWTPPDGWHLYQESARYHVYERQQGGEGAGYTGLAPLFTGAGLAAAIVWATAPGRLHWLDALLHGFGRVS